MHDVRITLYNMHDVRITLYNMFDKVNKSLHLLLYKDNKYQLEPYIELHLDNDIWWMETYSRVLIY